MTAFNRFEELVREFVISSSVAKLNSVFPGFDGSLGDCLFPAFITPGQRFSEFRIRAGTGGATSLAFSKVIFVGQVDGEGDFVNVAKFAKCSQSSALANVKNGAAGTTGNLFSNNVHTKRETNPWWQAEFPENVSVRYVFFYRRVDSQIVNDSHIRLSGVAHSGAETILYYPQGGEDSRNQLADSLMVSFQAFSDLSEGLNGRARQQFEDAVSGALARLTSELNRAMHPRALSGGGAAVDLGKVADDLLDAANLALGYVKDFGNTADDGLDISLTGIKARHVRFRAYGALPRGLRGVEIYGDNLDTPSVVIGKSALRFKYKAPMFLSPESFAVGLQTHLPSRRVDLQEVQGISRIRVWNLEAMDAANTLFLEVAVRLGENDPWEVVYDHGAPYRNVCKALKLINCLVSDKWTPSFARLLGKMFTQYRRRALMNPVARFVRSKQELSDAIFEGSNEISKRTRHASPLRLGKHGLAVPIGFRDTKTVMAHLVEMRDKIRALGHKPLFMYGTLLGAIREKDFIPHDDDVDLAVILHDIGPEDINAECDRFIELLNANGVKANRGAAHAPLIHCHRGPITYDIFLFAHVDDIVYWQHTALKTVPERADIFLPIGTVEFKGEIFDAPNDPEAVCEARYGSDWRIPNAAFEW